MNATVRLFSQLPERVATAELPAKGDPRIRHACSKPSVAPGRHVGVALRTSAAAENPSAASFADQHEPAPQIRDSHAPVDGVRQIERLSPAGGAGGMQPMVGNPEPGPLTRAPASDTVAWRACA